MTARERYELIKKKEDGMLTDEEYLQYIDLLQKDPTFYDEVIAHQFLEDATRAGVARGFRSSVQKAMTEERTPKTFGSSIRRLYFPLAYAAAAVLVLVALIAVWLSVVNRSADSVIVKVEKKNVFSADTLNNSGQGYASGNQPIGTVAVQWFENSRQPQQLAYLYCRDTLKVFVRNSRDTVRLNQVGLVYNATQRKLYWSQVGKAPMAVQECTSTPQALDLLK